MLTPKLDIATLPADAGPAESSSATRPRPANDALRIDVFDSMAPLEAEWRGLERDNLASLHQSYDWCATWVATSGNPLAVLRGTFGARTAFILPLEIVRANMVRSAQFIAARRSNINTGLFSAEFLDAAPDGLGGSQQEAIVRALHGRADLLLLQNVPFDWRGRRSPLTHFPSVENQNRAFQLPILETMEATIRQVNAKRRRKKYRHQSRLLDEMGGYDHVVAGSPEERHSLLDLFFRQKTQRFRMMGLPDVFQTEETRRFLHGLLDIGPTGPGDAPLEMHALRLKGRHEGHVPAIAALSRKGDHVICQFASIDESRVPEASPGELLFWLMIERFHDGRTAMFDFGIGDQLYKRSWCPVETVQHDAILPVSALGHVAAFAQRGVVRTKAAIKANPKIYSFIQQLRARADGRGETGPADRD